MKKTLIAAAALAMFAAYGTAFAGDAAANYEDLGFHDLHSLGSCHVVWGC